MHGLTPREVQSLQTGERRVPGKTPNTRAGDVIPTQRQFCEAAGERGFGKNVNGLIPEWWPPSRAQVEESKGSHVRCNDQRAQPVQVNEPLALRRVVVKVQLFDI